MKPFDYHRPGSIAETIALLQASDGDNRTYPLAGGTDLLTLLKADLISARCLVDIKRLPGLSATIEQTEHGLSIGALTSLSAIENDPLIQSQYALLSEAAALAATPQLRNQATLGGNLLQRPRCWYFRHPDIDCWLKGGEQCPARQGENQLHGLFGEGPCFAVHPSDLAPALIALDAKVRLRGPDGDRTVALTDFFVLPQSDWRRETLVQSDELLLAVDIPARVENSRSTYLKAMDRQRWSFALAGVAALISVDEDKISHCRLVLSGAGPIPWRLYEVERLLLNTTPSTELFTRAAATAVADAQPLSKNQYKEPLLRGLIYESLTALVDVESG